MDDVKWEFRELLALASEGSLQQEKNFILCLGAQQEISDNPEPAAACL